jgi:RNA polymerase sigma factor (sigma-70 family)
MFLSVHSTGFETVVRAYANDVFRYLYWLCRDRNVAEDLSQETFTRAWAAWEGQRDEKALKAWLFTIARNEHARLYERKRLDIDPDAELDAIVSRTASDPRRSIRLRPTMPCRASGFGARSRRRSRSCRAARRRR